jgi:hypothetical protein
MRTNRRLVTSRAPVDQSSRPDEDCLSAPDITMQGYKGTGRSDAKIDRKKWSIPRFPRTNHSSFFWDFPVLLAEMALGFSKKINFRIENSRKVSLRRAERSQ